METAVISSPSFIPASIMMWLRKRGQEFLGLSPDELTRKQLRVIRAAKEVGLDVPSSVLELRGAERAPGSEPSVVFSGEIDQWVQETGPRLLATMRQRDLNLVEATSLHVVKELCPCHRTDEPQEFSHNRENCDICGRGIF